MCIGRAADVCAGASVKIPIQHTLEVPKLTAKKLTTFYRRWAAANGLRALPPVGEPHPERPYLSFRHEDRGLDVSIAGRLPSSVVIHVWPTRPDESD